MIAPKTSLRSHRRLARKTGLLVGGGLLCAGMGAWALVNGTSDLNIVAGVHGLAIDTIGGHVDQAEITKLVASGHGHEAFVETFEIGDEMFSLQFSATDGGGANVGGGQRYTRMPRADLKGSGEWFSHTPARATGPNSANCTGCHAQPADDGAGPAAANVHRDPMRTGAADKTIQRNTPALFGLGALQLLAEEMTETLWEIRAQARQACGCGANTNACRTSRELSAKGIAFGRITVNHTSGSRSCAETLDPPAGGALAISSDLVVRPFQWKGSVAFIRDFTRGAAHNELGVQGTELLGSPSVNPASIDGDGDGVKGELTVGDMTALTVYQAGQPRPTTRQELASLGLIPPLSATERSDIAAGSQLFDQLACARCHTRRLTIEDPIFREPSANPNFRDGNNRFPNGRSLAGDALDPARPVVFDLTKDMLENNGITLPNGQTLGNFVRDSQGRAVVDLFGDLRRHDMGPRLAEQVDEIGTGKAVFMTENLWGVGSTAPYLHDGRATTLAEAILEHGGEAEDARNRFTNLSSAQRKQLVAFLNNLVLFKPAE